MIKIRNKLELNIRGWLIVGFAMLVLVLAAAVSTTVWKISKFQVGADRIVDLRVPTVRASCFQAKCSRAWTDRVSVAGAYSPALIDCNC